MEIYKTIFLLCLIILIILSLGITMFKQEYVRIDKIPKIFNNSKYTSIMYMQKEIVRLEKELEEKQGKYDTICIQYDISRLQETIDFLQKF